MLTVPNGATHKNPYMSPDVCPYVKIDKCGTYHFYRDCAWVNINGYKVELPVPHYLVEIKR